MKNICILIIFVVFGFCANAQNFKHPGLLSSKAELDYVKSQVEEGKEPWVSAISHIKSLNFDNRQPTPNTNLTNSGGAGPMDEMTRDGSAAYGCALLWYHTGEKKYADHAIKILNAWNIFETHDNWLYLSWAIPQFLNAAEIIRTSDAGWSLADQEKFKSMVQNRWLRPVKNNTWVNNAMMTTIEAHIAVSIYLDNEQEFNQAINKWRKWIPSYMYLKSDGDQPVLEGRSKIDYWGSFPGKYLEGQVMETCRDLNHTKMGTYGLMHGAEMAYQQGVDLWQEQASRFSSFMELHAGWMTGKEKVPSWMCEGDGINCTGKGGNPPCNQANWDIAIGHLVDRLGYDLPTAKSMSAANRNREGDTKRNFKFETLTHGDLPYSLINNLPPTGFTFAADENDTVLVIDQVVDIAYGAYGEYIYLYNQTSNAVCNSASFGGDPLPDSTKKCYVKPVVFVDGISLDKHSVSVEMGKTIQLNKTISPSNAKNKTVVWSANDTTIAKVSAGGLVTAMAVGTVTIKVLTNDGGFADSCEVTVVTEKFPNIEHSDGAQAPNIPENLYDGLTDDDHRWSVNNFPKSVVIDYGETKSFSGAKVFTYQNRSYHYTIAISDSEKSGFTTVVEQTGSAPSQPIEHSFSPFNGRYVKLEVTGATAYSSSWVSINELEMLISDVSGIGEMAGLNNHVCIYPTIADEELNVSLNYEKYGKVDVRIVGAYGQLCLKQRIDGGLSKINISNLASGIYFITIAGSDAQVTRKFIKK